MAARLKEEEQQSNGLKRKSSLFEKDMESVDEELEHFAKSLKETREETDTQQAQHGTSLSLPSLSFSLLIWRPIVIGY